MLISKLEKSLLTILLIILLNVSMSGCTYFKEKTSDEQFEDAFGDFDLFSCYYDTGIKEINDTPVKEEFEYKSFGLAHDPEIEWFWWFAPESLQKDINVWKRDRNYIYDEYTTLLTVSTQNILRNNELNLDSKQKNRPKEVRYFIQYKLDSKGNLTWVSENLFIYEYYQKKITTTRTGKCIL